MEKPTSHKISPSLDERGLVAIIIVTTISIILSLMTIGFTRIMDRELREAIDLDLATQAHYAAEAGLNDSRLHVAQRVADGDDPSTVGTECHDLSDAPFVASISGSYSGDTEDNLVKYTCVLIDATPNTLVYDLSVGESVVFRVSGSDIIEELLFSWQNLQQSGGLEPLVDEGENLLPQESAVPGDATGILRAAIYPIPSGTFNDDSLVAGGGLRTYFLYPNIAGSPGVTGSVSYGVNGSFVNGNCHEQNPPPRLFCNSGVNEMPGNGLYIIRLTAVYKDLRVSIQGENAAGQPVEFRGAQAVIDVTGEGNDVLKRIQARAPLGPSFQLPEFALRSMETLCKRIRIPQTGLSSFGQAETNDSFSGQDDACRP